MNPETYILKQILSTDRLEHLLLASLLHLAGQKELVQNEVGFLEVEDYVQLTDLYAEQELNNPTTKWRKTHAPEVPIQQLHIAMNDLQTQ